MKFKLDVPEFQVSNDAKFMLASFVCFLFSVFCGSGILDLWCDSTVSIIIGISIYLCLQMLVYMKWGPSK